MAAKSGRKPATTRPKQVHQALGYKTPLEVYEAGMAA